MVIRLTTQKSAKSKPRTTRKSTGPSRPRNGPTRGKTDDGPAPEPWEQQPKESAEAYRAFRIYRDLAIEDRSLRRVSEILAEQNLPPNHRHIKVWSSKYSWLARWDAWEQEQDRVFRQEFVQRRRQMARRHAAVGGYAMNVVAAKLRKLVQQVQIDPDAVDRLAIRDMTTLMREAAQIERQAVGDPHPMRLEHSGPDGGPITIDDDDELSLLAELQIIQSVLSERLGVDES